VSFSFDVPGALAFEKYKLATQLAFPGKPNKSGQKFSTACNKL